MKEYSLKKLGEIQKDKKCLYCDLDYTPLSIPLGHVVPETTNQAIARILYHSGSIDSAAYDAIRGVSYDGDYADGDEPDFDDGDYDDDYELSKYSKYEDSISVALSGVSAQSDDAQVAAATEKAAKDGISPSNDGSLVNHSLTDTPAQNTKLEGSNE